VTNIREKLLHRKFVLLSQPSGWHEFVVIRKRKGDGSIFLTNIIIKNYWVLK
jgi:hypothetical protein